MKRTGPTHLHLEESNNLFVDLERVQQSMLRHYEVTAAGKVNTFSPYLTYISFALKCFDLSICDMVTIGSWISAMLMLVRHLYRNWEWPIHLRLEDGRS
jgi:hypothetical protein